jgi:hypothetical protein
MPEAGMRAGVWKLCKTYSSVILNEVKDLELVEKTIFFSSLRMTGLRYLGFCNSSWYTKSLLGKAC